MMLSPAVVALQAFLLLLIFFARPAWCRDQGAWIDSNCGYNFKTGESYIRSVIPLFNSKWIPITRWFALFGLTVHRIVRYTAIWKNDQERKICIAIVILASMTSIFMVFSTFGVHVKGGRFLMMVYLIVYNESLRLNLNRLIRILIDCMELIFLYFTLLLVLSIAFRYIFNNEPQAVITDTGKTDSIWFLWDFTSLSSAFMTELIAEQGGHLPTVIIVTLASSKWKALLFHLNVYFCKYWIYGILRGTVLNTYRSFYTNSMLSLLTKQRDLYDVIAISFIEFQSNVPKPIVYKIVQRYWYNKNHSFDSDDELARDKLFYLRKNVEELEAKEKIDFQSKSTHQKMTKFLNSKWWTTFVLLLDVAQIVGVFVATDHYLPGLRDSLKLRKDALIAKDTALAKLLEPNVHYYGSFTYYGFMTSFFMNLPSLLNLTLHISCRGFRAVLNSTMIFDVIIGVTCFAFGTTLLSFDSSIYKDPEHMNFSLGSQTFMIIVSLKLLPI